MGNALENCRVLVADDEKDIRESIAEVLEDEGFEVEAYGNGSEVIERIKKSGPSFHIAILDIQMPGADGLEVLKSLQSYSSDTYSLILTSHGNMENVLTAFHSGAVDYLLKPVDFDILIQKLKLLQKNKEMQMELRKARREVAGIRPLKGIPGKFGMIGDSPVMREVFQLIESCLDNHANVLIQGASGTGKELVAKAIHFYSHRRERPYVPINCAAIPENLFESELFGYKRGAFTGAVGNKSGLICTADKGTLFLDEIPSMPFTLQSKLLRVIEDRQVLSLGATRPREVDVRFISASNRNLKQEIQEGRFREDLFYRLNVVYIKLPSLSERTSDIPHLLRFMINRLNTEMGKKFSFPEEAIIEQLMSYDWPGNVRELENVIERMMIVERTPTLTQKTLSKILGSQLGGSIVLNPTLSEEKIEEMTLKEALQRFEKSYVSSILHQCEGNKKKASEILGISLATFYRRSGMASAEKT